MTKQSQYCYRYPRPALTVDCVVFGIHENRLQLLLIERAQSPFSGTWALPGGFVDMQETSEEAARRELEEETGLTDIFLEQLYTFSRVDRDPRERVVSVAYFALVRSAAHAPEAASDAAEARWFDADQLPELAFDHAAIIETARQRLRGKIQYQPLGFELLPELFTLRELQSIYEIILGQALDKRNFRRKLLGTGVLEETDSFEQGVPRRPARLYRFNRQRYQKLVKGGFEFEVS
jgi:8-oxo-dGTP diphosphatase